MTVAVMPMGKPPSWASHARNPAPEGARSRVRSETAAFSLNSGLLSRPPFGWLGRNAHFSFGARGAPSRMEAVPASQFACGPSGGQKAAGACRDKIGASRAARLEGLLEAEDVPAGDQDLAGDGGLGRVRLAGARLDVRVEPVPGVRLAPGALGGLDGGEAQRARTRLRELARARALARLLDARGETGVADQLARRGKAGDVADLGGDREP